MVEEIKIKFEIKGFASKCPIWFLIEFMKRISWVTISRSNVQDIVWKARLPPTATCFDVWPPAMRTHAMPVGSLRKDLAFQMISTESFKAKFLIWAHYVDFFDPFEKACLEKRSEHTKGFVWFRDGTYNTKQRANVRNRPLFQANNRKPTINL